MLSDLLLIIIALALFLSIVGVALYLRREKSKDSHANLLKYLNYSISQTKNENDKIALLYIDLDNFKNINEMFGFKASNKLLSLILKKLEGSITIPGIKIFYLFADRFAVTFPLKTNSSKTVTLVAEQCLQYISEIYRIKSYQFKVTGSIGISIYPETTDSGEDMIHKAESAMIEAKKLGKNTYSFFVQPQKKEVASKNQLSIDLGYAIEKNELKLFHQPKVCIKTGRVVGSEALIRWKHTKQGLISPAEFIPIAEETGLIVPIGNWIIKQACKDIVKIHEKGFDDIAVAVNISSFQFQKGDIAQYVAESISETKINPVKLELELTESLIMQDIEKSLLMLRVLKSMGMLLAIDDFGTGHSSLSKLKQFPVNYLKIDQEFVKNMHLDKDKSTIVFTIITLAKCFGFKVIAEGAEVQEEIDALKAMGCDIVQGYYYSKPLSFDEYLKFIEDNYSNTQPAAN